MKSRARTWAWGCCLLFLAGLAQASAGVKATLDRNHVQLGDSVTLTLERSGNSDALAPDLSPLAKDFQILGRSSSISQRWTSSGVTATSTLSIGLRPLHEGALQIPALQVGASRTRPLILHVGPPAPQGQGKAGDPAFVEASLSSPKAYVGQQVVLDVRLFYSSALMDGSTSTPQIDGAKLSPLGRAARYQTQRGGMSYRVVEWHYAVIPGKTGTLELAPIQFSGHLLEGGNPLDFFSSGKRVTARSNSLELRVLQRPKGSGTGPWLPARQLELSLSGLPASGHVSVGEPVTITIHEGATGLAADALPEPTLPDIPGAQVYPDQTQDVTRNNDQWLTGSRSRSFAIVPERAGTLRLPEITLPWWNVVSDHAETARIPAQTLTVMPVAGAAPSGTTAAPATPAKPPAARPVSTGAGSVAQPQARPAASALARPTATIGGWPWRPIALASLGLWVLSLAGLGVWWRVRHRSRAAANSDARQRQAASSRALRNGFLAAVRRQDPPGAARALLRWAQSERPGIGHLGALAAGLEDPAQVEAIGTLQRSQFAPEQTAQVRLDALARAFRGGLAWRTPVAMSNPAKDPLPPLYPPH